MSQIANTGSRRRPLLWIGIAAAIVAIAVFRVRLGTVVYLAFFLGFPFLMMRMHGGGHGGSGGGGLGCGGGHGSHGDSSEQDDRARDSGEARAGHQH